MTDNKNTDFNKSTKMLEKTNIITETHKTIDNTSVYIPNELSGCKKLSLIKKTAYYPPYYNFEFYDKNDGKVQIYFDPHYQCCEALTIDFDNKPYYDKNYNVIADKWCNIFKDLSTDNVTFSLRITHDIADGDLEFVDGGSVIVDFSLGDTFDENKIVHCFTFENEHNGYYSHTVEIGQVNGVFNLQFCL
jgi:hypothetical protein